jgi:UDP-N-acetylmuramoyl-L-alanyl-D-glutamate--2,6-diaminopimelate ligase
MSQEITSLDLLKRFITLNGYNSKNLYDKFSLDSREVRLGQVFLSLDKNQHKNLINIKHAIKNGACAFVSTFQFTRTKINSSIPFFVQKNLREYIYKLYQSNFRILDSKTKTIGVTGTNGKTSTVLLLAQSLISLNKKVGVISSEGIGLYPLLEKNDYTTPPIDTIYKNYSKFIAKKYDYVIIESSSQGLHQGRLKGICFDYSFITNIYSDHLDYHKNIKSYARAKLSIIQQSKCIILNNDSDTLMKELTTKDKIKYAFISNDVRNKKKCLTTYNDQKKNICIGNKNIKLTDYNILNFNIYSLLFICSFLYLEDYKNNTIKKVINTLNPLPGRRQVISTKKRGKFVIDYAHTIQSFHDIFMNFNSNSNITTLFGCGGDRDKSKRKIIAKTVDSNSSFSIITEDNSRNENFLSILYDIKSGFGDKKKYIVIESRKKAIKYLFKNSKKDSLNFILGKGNEDYILKKNKKIRHNDINYLNLLINKDES